MGCFQSNVNRRKVGSVPPNAPQAGAHISPIVEYTEAVESTAGPSSSPPDPVAKKSPPPYQVSLPSLKRDDSFQMSEVQTEVSHRRRSQHLTQNMVVENIDRDIQDFYSISSRDVLGDGLNGIVVKGTHRVSGVTYAIKTLYKRNIKTDSYFQVKDEIRIMQDLDHPNILRLHEYFEDEEFIFLVSELCTGGELLARLYQQEAMHYNERTACEYVESMLSAVRYCHSHNIVHRDLKLENFLFENPTPTSALKLIDFGLSRHFGADEKMNQPVGTPYYIAPEVLESKYDARCDIWSLGVIAYMLMSGKPPFDGPSNKDIMKSIRKGHWNFPREFDSVSPRAKNFITTCLSHIDKRPSAEELSHHPWFQIVNETSDQEPLSVDIIERLQVFGSRNMISRLCMEVVAHTMQSNQIEQLRKEFAKIDTANAGVITYGELREILRQSSAISEEEMAHIYDDVNFDHTGEINYHEFLAATMSRSLINEGNMKLAFMKISNNETFFTGEDLTRVAGIDSSSEKISESLVALNIQPNDRIDYDMFKEIVQDRSYKTPKAATKKVFFAEEDSSTETASLVTATLTADASA